MKQVSKGKFYRIVVALHLVLIESKGNFDTFWMQLSWLHCVINLHSGLPSKQPTWTETDSRLSQ